MMVGRVRVGTVLVGMIVAAAAFFHDSLVGKKIEFDMHAMVVVQQQTQVAEVRVSHLTPEINSQYMFIM